MEKRMKQIYNELYNGIKGKNELASKFNVNTKTIENTINKYNEDIIMDKSLGGYRFSFLLPNKISSIVLFDLFKDSIENQIIKNDFIYTAKDMFTKEDADIHMIETKNLSALTQKIIMCHLAINTSCALKIDYFGNRGDLERKYIKPHRIFVDAYKYYLYASYIEKNEKNIGEFRSFTINSISLIEQDEYSKNEVFYIDSKINSYGVLNKEKYVVITLRDVASNFFKKNGMFNKDNYDFIIENIDGSIDAKMYFNNIQEIVKLVQMWMPFISIRGEIAEKVYGQVRNNYKHLLGGSI